MSNINFFAKTNFRGQGKLFGIKREDRHYHIYVIGKTGMGKTTLLLNMAYNDVVAGEGVGFIDPHGDLAEKLVEHIPKERMKDLNPQIRMVWINRNLKEWVDKKHKVDLFKS